MNIFETDKEFVMQTYGRYEINFIKGKGATLTSSDGKKYIDFMSGIGVNSIGYGDKKWAKAVSKQAANLAHVSNYFYTTPYVKVAELLCKKSKLSKVFFQNSGAEANECAIKVARKYSFDKYGEGRFEIISLVNSFHGRTMTTLTATGQDSFHNFFFPFAEAFSYSPINDIEALKANISDKTCAIMLEGVQGEGGVYPLEKEFVKEVFEIAKEKDILIIFDEVQTGIGRCGRVFSFESFDVLPDIVTVAKGLGGGLPIGACIVGKKCENTLQKGQHGSTFGANPVVCAGAAVVLEKVTTGASLHEVTKKGEYIKKFIENLNSSYIKEIRGMGLMIGCELAGADVKAVAGKMVAEGLLIITAGENTLRMLPPLTISYKEIDKGLEIFKKVMGEING